MTTSPTHAALMNSVYRRQRYIYDFTRKYYLFGRDRLIAELAPKPGARIVEVGCGTARNLILMAKRYPGRRFFGLDASDAMLDTARRAVERAGLKDQITLAHGYAEALSPSLFGESAAFDDAVFSYSLSMIPDWKQSLKAATSALAEGGRIHIVDFGDLDGLVRTLKKGLLAWLRLFHVAPRVELLATLERQTQKSAHFRVLPGRYAFLLTCNGADLANLEGAVALQSQGGDKTPIAPA